MSNNQQLRQKARDAAVAGLDFLVRTQNTDDMSADFGRMAFTYDCQAKKTLCGTTSWTTGTCCAALLAGYKFTGDEKYLEAAKRAISYIKTLQNFDPLSENTFGAMNENTPAGGASHPRDGLTAAWAMLDYSQQCCDSDTLNRATLFADWFCQHAMREGYPYWTVNFYSDKWKRDWCGSFHSGSAFFLHRIYQITGDTKYRQSMKIILDYFNTHCLNADGSINVIIDRDSGKVLDDTEETASIHSSWQVMHRYNDDFGCLANLAASTIESEPDYLDAAIRFLKRMIAAQRPDGGFGPQQWSVPSGGGCILMELMAARKLGHNVADDDAIERVVDYLISTQYKNEGDIADGAFFGFNGPNDYQLSDTISNARTGGYAIMGLLRVAGAEDPYYFFE